MEYTEDQSLDAATLDSFDVHHIEALRGPISRHFHRLPQSSFRDCSVDLGAADMQPRGKRPIDVLFAVFCLVLLLPLLVFVTGLILALEGRPVFFKHKRIGKHGRNFDCLKFRTMRRDGDKLFESYLEQNPAARSEWESTRKVKQDPRVTFVGAILRRSSIDELPQLINILVGDMSFVGPRPIVKEEVHLYGERIDDYYRAHPGLTGLWQISGRSDVSFEARVRLDSEYVKNRTLIGDLAIIVKTVPAVFLSRGCY